MQIARAVEAHKAKVTVYVPVYAMSGGTLIALAADEIVLGEFSVLGPIDPQIAGLPAASIVKARDSKPIAEVFDLTLVLADVSEKALAQVRRGAVELLTPRMELSAAEALAAKLAGGHWTHDYALTASEAATLGLTISPLARWLITTYDWRTAMLTIGVLAWSLLLPAALLVRRPPAVAATPAVGGGPGVTLDTVGMSAAQALRSPQFLVLGFTFFACCAAHSGPIFHMVSYAIFCGLAPMAAVSVYSVEGLAGLGGRLLLGLLGDRFGAKPVLIAGLLVQALAIGTYVFVSRLGEFYALAVVFGTAYGGVMPLYAVLAREYFGQRIMGTVFGAATMLSSIGMAFGPLAGGWIYDTFDAYSWLFLGSFAVGLGAVAVALAFPPLPRARLQPA
jgi:MFS family permease